MSAPSETWRVITPEGLFETDLETLKQWILENSVHPTDKVSKGNLNWIEAGRAPLLRPIFLAKEMGLPVEAAPALQAHVPAPVISPPDLSGYEAGYAAACQVFSAEARDSAAEVPFTEPSFEYCSEPAVVQGASCHNHAGSPAKFICRACGQTFCDECPKFVGATKIAVCPLCGDMCKSYAEEARKSAYRYVQSKPFGFEDFKNALAYPFKHKTALATGALIYSFLLIAGLRGKIVAYVLLFGCISHIISQFAWGRFDRSFMRDFSDFSLWDDLVCPIFLGVGIVVVTYGPLIVLLLALIFGIVHRGLPSLAGMPSAESGSGAPPGGEAGSAPAAENGGPLDKFDEARRDASPKTAGDTGGGAITGKDLGTLLDPNADPKKLEEANKKLDQLRPGHGISEEAKRSQDDENDPLALIKMLGGYVYMGIAFAGLGLLAWLWSVFYYPMALAVAGYTERFSAVVNPLVGLDTIRRMGAVYWKAFLMIICIQVAGFVLSVVALIILSPFTLPFVGNLPARFVDGALTFYSMLVIACILGYSLFKCADRLGIDTD
jgi:hypothetical protein